MKTRSFAFPALLLGAVSLGGCSNLFPPTCTTEASPAVQVRVLDSATGAPAAEGAKLVIRDGAYADSATGFPGVAEIAAGFEETGTFDVLVRKAGYREWTRQDVRVTRGGSCDKVQTARLTAELERAP
jgi:hypothetical protein